jgi:GrpB-like predicted nucleotidyltransferase (UPF0157 family)
VSSSIGGGSDAAAAPTPGTSSGPAGLGETTGLDATRPRGRATSPEGPEADRLRLSGRPASHVARGRRSSQDRVSRVAPGLDPDLAARLRDLGIDPEGRFDPEDVWRRLRKRHGRRATLIDRYALEARARNVPPDALDTTLRERLTLDVLRESVPGVEWPDGFRRASQEAIEVVPWDPAWPSRYQDWRGRLATALGPAALRIDHVGSTSVPGLAGKPVIDVQVSVRDVEDEASYVPAVEGAGVRLRMREPGHRYFRPVEGLPREIHVHACAAGSDWERDHLLFRDYLRAHPAVASEYGRRKEALAERYRTDRVAYTEAKTCFILDALERAARWAAATGWRV